MNIFFDLGAWEGDTIKDFLKRPDAGDWWIIAFEPNPACYPALDEIAKQHDNVEIAHAAAGTADIIQKLYIGKNMNGEGSTIVPGKMTGGVNYAAPIPVETMDFAETLRVLVNPKYDHVVCKINIEGGEYPLLNHLIATDTLKLVNEVVVYFHDHKFHYDADQQKQFADCQSRFIEYCRKHNIQGRYGRKDGQMTCLE